SRLNTPGSRADYAFMVGIMSLADAVLGLQIEEIFAQVRLIDEVKEAVIKHEGFFGQMLVLVQKVQAGEFTDASRLGSKLGLSPAELNSAQLEAIQWDGSLTEEGLR